ncbi:MAG: putative dienelactone hydrolase [Myxococcota bacterium]|jgi:predicted dienelactone hydrolase
MLSMLLLLLGCADPIAEDPYADLAFPPAGPNHAPDASTWGPFPVGVTTLWLTDPERTLDDGSPRIIPVEVWYPSASTEGELRTYAVADFVPEERLAVEDIDPEQLPWLTSTSLDESEPDTAHGPYPLVVFSHGNGGMRLQSMFFTEYLASHGYVVASPDHIGNTLADLLIPGESGLSSTADSFLYRPDDIRMVVDRLRGSDDPAPVSDGDWGIAGHSLGAWTALHAAGEEEGIAVTIAQAPPDIQLALAGTGTAPDELEMPVMIQAGTADQILDYATNADPSFDLMAPPSLMATYFDAGHFTFSDLCILDLGVVQELIEDSVGNVMQDGCGPENPDVATILPLLRFHAIGLINATLRDSPQSVEVMLAGPGGELEAMFQLEGEL